MDSFIERIREAINQALEEGYLSLDAGEGTEVCSLEELLSVLAAEKARRSTDTN
jgi:hypothetical protein